MKQWIILGVILLIVAIGVGYGFKGHRKQAPKSAIELAGIWRGKLGKNRVSLSLSPSLEVTFNSPRQGISWVGVDRFSYNEGHIEFAIDRLAASFKGTVSGDEMSGTWTQNQVQRQLTLRRRTTRSRSDSSLRSS